MALVATVRARAATPVEEAHAAYDRGLAAHASGDEETAAREFARADELVPTDAAIEAAIESATKAGDAVLAIELVERADARVLDPQATRAVADARKSFISRVAHVRVDCAGAASCRASVDGGASASVSRARVVAPGEHVVVVERDGVATTSTLHLAASETVVLTAVAVVPIAPAVASVPASIATTLAPPMDPRSPSATRVGIAVVGFAITGVVGGFALASAVDAHAKHDTFVQSGCSLDAAPTQPMSPSCGTFADEGRSAQTRTNYLAIGLGVAAAGTLTYLVFAHPFSSDVSVGVGPSSVALALAWP